MGKQQRDTHKVKERGKEKRKYKDEHKKQLPSLHAPNGLPLKYFQTTMTNNKKQQRDIEGEKDRDKCI